MSRYIDADMLINIFMSKLDDEETLFNRVSRRFMRLLKSSPSIDIVRCKECKHCSKDRIKWSVKDEDGNWIDTKCNLCRRTKLEVNLDDFCSYGEREGE